MTDTNFALDNMDPLPSPASADGIALAVSNGGGYVNMRCAPSDTAAINSMSALLGQEIPLEPNTFTEGRYTVFWLGPDEWLIVCDGDVRKLLDDLRRVANGHYASFVDVSDGMLCVTLAGPPVRDLLAKGCTLDLYEQQFGPGQCAQTLLAKAPVLLACSRQDASFQIHVRRSFAEYAVLWLRHAAAEFGIFAQQP